jgi:nitrate reductase delta subunit
VTIRLYDALANLIVYPQAGFMELLDESLTVSCGELNSMLGEFRLQTAQIGIPRLQEIYSEVFDFRPETSLYVGHHLFGEEIRRNLFMAQLRGQYREAGIPDMVELPDHLAEVLRFLAVATADDDRVELIRYCLLPAVQHLLHAFKSENPYTYLLQAILFALRQDDTSISKGEKIAWALSSSSSFPMLR